MMKRDVIAKRIREARERCGLSQQELANLMGWKSHASLAAIEGGSQDVKTWELLKFANIMKVPPESLYSDEIKEISEFPAIQWRNRATDPKVALREERDVFQHCEDYRLIKHLMGELPSTKQLPCEIFDIIAVDYSWANLLAERMHRELNLGDYPASLLAQRLEEDYGVLIMRCQLENGSAACCRAEWGAAIVLNGKEVHWRQMFNLAHELFHIITWCPRLIEQVSSDEELFNKNERLANAFAGALLMPQQMIDIDVRGNKLTYSFLVALARKYRVSTSAMLWRLFYLRVISRASVERALEDEDFKKLDHATSKEALETTQPFDNRFLRLAYLAYEKGMLSKGRFAQMLRVKLRDLNQYLSDKGLYLTNDKEIETNTD
jgi:Zn-dependent peptidase ImmA (M78 family)/DNA-binding XRE family transcriptional regulator